MTRRWPRYTTAYQSIAHLTLGELWSIPIMLRLALIENLRRVAVSMTRHRTDRDLALAWAQRIDAPSDKHENALLVLADMVREDPPLSTAFVAQFTQALQGHGATNDIREGVAGAATGRTRHDHIEEVVRAESQIQAADHASMANSIASLRLVQRPPSGTSSSKATAPPRPSCARIPQTCIAGWTSEPVTTTGTQWRPRRGDSHIDEEVVARTAVTMAAHDMP